MAQPVAVALLGALARRGDPSRVAAVARHSRQQRPCDMVEHTPSPQPNAYTHTASACSSCWKWYKSRIAKGRWWYHRMGCLWEALGGCTVTRRQLAGWQRVVLTVMTGPAHGALALARRLQGTAPSVSCPTLSCTTLRATSGVPCVVLWVARKCGSCAVSVSMQSAVRAGLQAHLGAGVVPKVVHPCTNVCSTRLPPSCTPQPGGAMLRQQGV